MAVLSMTNANIYVAQANLSGHSNMVEITSEAEELDSTTFGSSGYKSSVGGLYSVGIKIGGFWQATDGTYPDDRLFTDLGVAAVPMSITPNGVTVADTAYFTKVMRPQYQLGAQVGELLGFESQAVGDGTALIRGQVADAQARTSTGTTTALSLTTPAADTRAYAAVHVTAVSGTATPTLTPTLQGDTASNFPSPTTIATGTGMTAVGAQWLAGSYGVSTDSFFRLSYVISGTNPSFSVVAFIGIGR